MTLTKAASTTYFWVKELSTSVFSKVGNKLQTSEFVRRNLRRILILSVLWAVSVVGVLIFFHSIGSRHRQEIFEQGTTFIRKLAANAGVSILEKDILTLNAALRAFEKIEHLHFIAVLDHKGTILAHTRPQLLNQTFRPLNNKKKLDNIDGVSIASGTTADGQDVVCFSQEVTYSKTSVGNVHFVFTSAYLRHPYGSLGLLFALSLIAITLLPLAIVFGWNRVDQARLKRVEKDLAGITNIGPYVLGRKIGQGGMAELYLADYVREDGFRKVVAVKIVHPHLLQYPEFVKMFNREARLAALLQHPNIVQIIDFGRINNASFLAMEYVHGKNLAEIVSGYNEPLPVDLCIFLMLQVSRGLHYSHTKRNESGEPLHIVHRDISPQNLLVSFQGEVKITDFGISKAKSEPSLTQAGVIKGKLAYMAPEHVLGETVNQQADIYSLGIVFYEILSNRRLYHFTTDAEAINTIPKKIVPPIKSIRPDIPAGLNSIVMKCLEKDLKLRYRHAAELYDDLNNLKKHYQITYDESNLISFMQAHFRVEDDAPMVRNGDIQTSGTITYLADHRHK